MRLSIVLGLMAAITSCGKKSSDDSTTADLSAQVQTALGLAYPGSLSLSVFPTDTSGTTLRLNDGADDASPESLKAKSEEAANYLNGKAENCLPPVFLRPAKQLVESCYEFDQEMIYGNRSTANGPGPFYGTPDGKSTIGGSQEACLVSFARAQIKEVENIIDQGLGLQQGMICQAVKDNVDVAAASTDDGLDLKSTLGEAMDSGTNTNKPKVTVEQAEMSKGTDGVYRVTIKVNMVTKDGKAISQTYSLNHVPDNADNSTYHGVMSIARSGEAGPKLEASAGTRYLSVAYTRVEENGAKKLRAELRTARFDSTLAAKALASDGTVDFNAGTGADNSYTGFANQNNAVASMMLVGFDLNTDNDTGTFEYWQNPGASYSEAARGMVFKLEQNPVNGRLEGCGMSGAALGTGNNVMDALSIRKAIKTSAAIRPTGSMHPFMNIDNNQSPGLCNSTSCAKQDNSAQWNLPLFSVAANIAAAADWAKKGTSPFVTRQCVGQNADGVYAIDPVRIADAAGFELFNPTSRTDLVIGRPERPKDAPPPPPAR